jgi:hypothetical protein
MIRFVLSLAFSLAVLFSFAQNLVPNPSFELTTSDCLPYPGLQGWFSPNLATPDLFTVEVETCWVHLSDQMMQELGFIAPLTGNNMVGLFCADPETSNVQTREYLACRLLEPLVQDEVYQVAFSTYRRSLGNFAIDKLGVHFSLDSFFYDVADMLPVIPQWENNQLHTISDEWTNYEFFYTADGGEQYLTFGCFRDYDEMQVIDVQTSTKDWNHAYYVFDDFSVEPAVNVASTEPKLFGITVSASELKIVTKEKGMLRISNLQGQEILNEPLAIGENVILFSPKSSGVYFATVHNDKQSSSLRFFWH